MRKRNKAAELNLTEEQLEEVERMLIRRWEELKPDWEIVIISLPKNNAELRKKILAQVMKTYTAPEFGEYCRKCRQKNTNQKRNDNF